jgi:hypothetical protein
LRNFVCLVATAGKGGGMDSNRLFDQKEKTGRLVPSGPPIADDADRANWDNGTDLADSPPARQAASTQRHLKKWPMTFCVTGLSGCRDAGKTRARPLKCLTGDCDAGQALSERCVGGHGRCAVRSTDNVGTELTVNRDTSVPLRRPDSERSEALGIGINPTKAGKVFLCQKLKPSNRRSGRNWDKRS